MRATEFEFRHRFWFICFAFFIGFGCYRFDHVNAVDGLAMWMFSRSDPNLMSLAAGHAIQALFVLSAVLVTAAAWIRTWGGAYLRAEVVHDKAVHTDRLVADGPYRHLRNPLYFGNMLLAAGMAMLASRIGSVVVILANLLIVLRLIGREEAALELSQGDDYRKFMAAVPRLWPSVRPRLPAGGMQAKWFQSFLGESHLWIFALDGFYFAWKLNSRLYVTVLWLAMVAYFLVQMGLKELRRRKLLSPAPPPLSSPSPRS
jgi:protein-S-isoprenylcysteine O-methyltransferase Ste14